MEYIYHGKEKLRCGYTTGSCAAAATKAALVLLFTSHEEKEVKLLTPKGVEVTIPIIRSVLLNQSASATVIKDGGDDPDVTSGMEMIATVEQIESGIEILGGKGIGKVTKEGLDQPVGNWAINSTPRKMMEEIVKSTMESYGYTGGIRVTIEAPRGEEIAKKTYNPRMGIVGGISIIGTSGIVEPMSNRAIIDTIALEEKMKKKEGHKVCFVTLGSYSDAFLEKEFPGLLGESVKASNFIGEAINHALSLDFESFLLVGHVGKLVKLGAGIMNTHSKEADGRMEVLVTCGVLAGISQDVLKEVIDCATVDAALELLMKEKEYDKMIEILLERIQNALDHKVLSEMKIGAILFSNKYGLIGKTAQANEIQKQLLEEYHD